MQKKKHTVNPLRKETFLIKSSLGGWIQTSYMYSWILQIQQEYAQV